MPLKFHPKDPVLRAGGLSYWVAYAQIRPRGILDPVPLLAIHKVPSENVFVNAFLTPVFDLPSSSLKV